jgi:hypothetical protein
MDHAFPTMHRSDAGAANAERWRAATIWLPSSQHLPTVPNASEGILTSINGQMM